MLSANRQLIARWQDDAARLEQTISEEGRMMSSPGENAIRRHHPNAVDVLTPANWRTSTRRRWSAGILMGATVEEVDGRFRGTYGNPPHFGAEFKFDTLEEALEWANRDSGGRPVVFDL
jgi:hypothetical protein